MAGTRSAGSGIAAEVGSSLEGPYERFTAAVLPAQLASLAELPTRRKHPLYEDVSLDDRRHYFAVSCRPLTVRAEDDMELLSDLVTQGERYLHEWGVGSYACARCGLKLYDSDDKWRGPCVWPSFRRPCSPEAVSTARVTGYNAYTCEVQEVYCGGCDLFIGHAFEDGSAKGDTHPDAHWRH